MSGDVLHIQMLQDPVSCSSSGAVCFPNGQLAIGVLLTCYQGMFSEACPQEWCF